MAWPCTRTHRLRNQPAPSGFRRTSRAARNQRRRFAFCLSRCNVLSCKVPLHSNEPAKGRTPVDDSSHSIDYHGAVAVSPVSAAQRSNQPVASSDNSKIQPSERNPASDEPTSSTHEDDDNLLTEYGHLRSAAATCAATRNHAKTDTGEEDTKTEQIIQQELQESSQDSGPQRPCDQRSPGPQRSADSRR